MSQVVIVAFGCEIRDFHYNTKAVKLLNDRAKVKKPDVWLFQDKAKGLDFEIRVVYTKAEFAAALDLDEAIVVYNGHSRFGQGPAFGPAHLSHCPDVQAFPVNPWEDHYRMGYDAIEIPCIEDIFEHCTNPTEIAKGKPKADLLLPPHPQARRVAQGRPLAYSSCRRPRWAAARPGVAEGRRMPDGGGPPVTAQVLPQGRVPDQRPRRAIPEDARLLVHDRQGHP